MEPFQNDVGPTEEATMAKNRTISDKIKWDYILFLGGEITF